MCTIIASPHFVLILRKPRKKKGKKRGKKRKAENDQSVLTGNGNSSQQQDEEEEEDEEEEDEVKEEKFADLSKYKQYFRELDTDVWLYLTQPLTLSPTPEKVIVVIIQNTFYSSTNFFIQSIPLYRFQQD